jgi:hypothetical protein
MSAITTTPAPAIGRKSIAVGLAVLGVVTVGAVALPRIHVGGTTTAPSVSQAQAPESLDRRDALVTAAAAQSSLRAQGQLDTQARVLGHRAVAQPAAARYPAHISELGALASAYGVAATSVGREQVGQYHRTYTWTPAMAVRNPLGSTDAHEQVPGLQGHYASGVRSPRLAWSDPWVPPVDSRDWTPFVRAHYYGGTVPERIVTRGD